MVGEPQFLRELTRRGASEDLPGWRDHDGGVADEDALAGQQCLDVLRLLEVDPRVRQAVPGGEGSECEGLW